ncbi:MAG: flagellar motor protein MotB [Sulfuriflexus sp.]|nr:flagellar motor protein MotB [Sulfuriflexus sp.]
MEDKKQPIIVKRINKGGHGHHGGAWKVAFADFAVAMMAFFMVMWLLGSVPTETLGGISDYFENVSLTEGQATVPTQGMAGPGGASTSMIDMGGMMDIAKGEGNKINQQSKADDEAITESEEDADVNAALKAEAEAQEAEEKKLNELMKDMVDAIGKNKALSPFKDQLLLQVTAEGLQIQIIDEADRAMFNSGGAEIQNHMREILYEIAGFLDTVPNRISVSGHTDASPFTAREDYGNWELSADRANSARRTLEEGGLSTNKIGRVEGLASSNLFVKDDPFSKSNRRISILVMNKKSEEALTGLIEDPEVDDANAAPVNEEPEELPPLQLQPIKAPLNGVEDTPRPEVKKRKVAPESNVLNARPELESEPVSPTNREDTPSPAPFGQIKLPPIIDPSLLPNN